MGINNREHEMANYSVTIMIDGIENGKLGPVILADGEKWEEQTSCIPDRPGDKQKLEFY